ncbi:MAG: DUF2125 domain-containing protein [Alphaproteobacteria bacterium]|nr:DUF2125 domain-containing protein [Alphaproteobacteria bacterium]
MKPAAFSPRTFFITAVTVVVILSAAAWGLWLAAAAQYRHVIDGWITQGRADGYHISYDDRRIFGFPRHIVMRLSNLDWKNTDGIAFHADAIDIAVTPWNWHDYQARFKNNVTLQAPTDDAGHALTLATDKGIADVTLAPDGTWKRAKLQLDNAKLGLAPHYLFAAAALDASVSRPDTPPQNHRQPGLTIDGDATGLTLPDAMPLPFGPAANHVAVTMRVMGRVPDVRERADVAAWNNDSGVVEFDKLDIDWGVLQMTSTGTMGFDDDLQPEGAFSGTIADPDRVMQALMKGGYVAARDAGMLDAAMKLFAKPAQGKDGQGMEFPITVQLGGLFFGPVRVFTFPAIEWPEAPPATASSS